MNNIEQIHRDTLKHAHQSGQSSHDDVIARSFAPECNGEDYLRASLARENAELQILADAFPQQPLSEAQKKVIIEIRAYLETRHHPHTSKGDCHLINLLGILDHLRNQRCDGVDVEKLATEAANIICIGYDDMKIGTHFSDVKKTIIHVAESMKGE